MTRARSALFVISVASALLIPFPAKAATAEVLQGRQAIVFVVGGVSFEELLTLPVFRALATSGGAGLMTTKAMNSSIEAAYGAVGNGTIGSTRPEIPTVLARSLDRSRLPYCEISATHLTILGESPTPNCIGADALSLVVFEAGDFSAAVSRRPLIERLGPLFAPALDALLRALPDHKTMVLVVTPSRSVSMDAVGDEVTPVLMAVGRPKELLGPSGSMHALTSDTTRQDGLVANVDVAPTILDFFGIPIPDEMTGSPIRIDGTADVAHLHRLHLDQRRIRLPLQLGEVAFVAFLGIVGIPMLIWLALGHALPSWMSSSMRFLCLCGVALMIPLMAGGLLPRLTYGVVVPFVVLSTLGLAALAQRARWRGPLGPFAFLAAATLAFIVLDALFGWRGMRVPLLGGTMFDGVRFYGLPNAFIAALLAGGLFVSVLLPPRSGAIWLFAAGLFAGFPALGANLGAAMTLFVAAGVWWVVRSRPRLDLKDLLFVAGVVAVGTAAVLLANRYLPGAPTHIAGFLDRTRGGFGGIWDAFRRRLDVGVGQIQGVPAAWIPLIGLPVILISAIVRPEPIRTGLDLAGTGGRHALVVLCVAAIASFFANDTGVAAAAPAFLYAATGMAYPVFLAAADR